MSSINNMEIHSTDQEANDKSEQIDHMMSPFNRKKERAATTTNHLNNSEIKDSSQ